MGKGRHNPACGLLSISLWPKSSVSTPIAPPITQCHWNGKGELGNLDPHCDSFIRREGKNSSKKWCVSVSTQPAHSKSTNGTPVCLALDPGFPTPPLPHLSMGQEVVKSPFSCPCH